MGPMPDYGHDLLFGASLVPDASEPGWLLDLADVAEELGLDLLSFQDHPYQPGFLDVMTLLSVVAARTSRIRLFPNVANLPLRPPAVLARAAASLDLLSNGRFELGLGAGYFLEPIAAMGGPKRTARENVEALDEGISVIRRLWAPGPPARFEGRYYRLDGARPGPRPQHDIGIWVGAYKPRMLELTGRVADGWIPSLGYAGPDELGGMSRAIDEAAAAAGRDPRSIRRMCNVNGKFAAGGGFLEGPPELWAERLAELAVRDGISAFVLAPGSDPVTDLQRFAEEVAPVVRELVAEARRSGPVGPPAPVVPSGPVAPTAVQQAGELVAGQEPVGAVGRQGQQLLQTVHQHLRQELSQLKNVVEQVEQGVLDAGAARSHINAMALRQNSWTLGAFCSAYCRVVVVHHTIEDTNLFQDLRAADPSLGPVLDRLSAEHEDIAGFLEGIDRALVAYVEDESLLDGVRAAVNALSDTLLPHLAFEEEQLLGPIGRLGIQV